MTLFDAYYNTTNLAGEELAEARGKAMTQEDRVRKFFRSMPLNFRASPEDVQRRVLPGAPLTSVRRAMTNLTRKGYLVKTDTKRTGRYGREAHTWRAAH